MTLSTQQLSTMALSIKETQCNDTQHNYTKYDDTWHNDTQHNGLNYDTQQKKFNLLFTYCNVMLLVIRLSVMMVSVVILTATVPIFE